MNQANYQFFMQANLSGYRGEWVAICDQKIISHGKNVKKVFREVKKKCPKKKPLITKVPETQTMIF